jgi:hypothetical protein
MITYWQKRENAKKYIAFWLRKALISKYVGLPVMIVRNLSDKIRQENKDWVKEALSLCDCNDFTPTWTTSFDYMLDENNTAIIFDFTVTVEGL